MIAVIGDIHGCYYTLYELVELIKKSYPNITLYCVGDLIDRGNNSFEVWQFIKKEKIIYTPGNHDYMCYYYFREPQNPIGSSWLYNGSTTTLYSFENKFDSLNEYLDDVISRPLFLNLEDCFISHAGISIYYEPKLPKSTSKYDESIKELVLSSIDSEHGILWTRDELVNLGKLQVVGHTGKREIIYNKENNSVYIDTHVYAGNKLSAIIVNKNEIIETFSINTKKEDLPGKYTF